jgi:hypothetical protein
LAPRQVPVWRSPQAFDGYSFITQPGEMGIPYIEANNQVFVDDVIGIDHST